MKKDLDRSRWLEQALVDETDIPAPVGRRVKVRNTDRLEVSPEKMTKKVEKKNAGLWLLLVLALVAAVVFAKWKGLI